MWPAVSCVKERGSFVNFARARLPSSRFRRKRVEDVQGAEPAFTSSVSGRPGAPGVRGSQLGEDFWKVYPLWRRDAPRIVKKTLQYT